MKNITLIENHREALGLWRQQRFKKQDLVHLDAHIDFDFYQIKPIDKIIEEATSLRHLKGLLESFLLYKRYRNDLEAQLKSGNYLYPAVRDGIIKKLYWIVPGSGKEKTSHLRDVKRQLDLLKSDDPYPTYDLRSTRRSLSCRLYNMDLFITDIFSLKKIIKEVLLDIDIDYLMFPSASDVSLTRAIGKRRPWLYPDTLATIIKTKFPKIRYTTIAYSVNGGYTPIEYRFFGDELFCRLSNKTLPAEIERILYLRNNAIESYFDNMLSRASLYLKDALFQLSKVWANENKLKVRLRAHLCFWLFKTCWKAGNNDEAKSFYIKAIRNDQAYATPYNNYGWAYLKKGDFKHAKTEFEKILFCSPEDPNALAGLGKTLLSMNRYAEAEQAYKKALARSPGEKNILLGLALVAMRTKRFGRADKILSRLRKIDPVNERRLIAEAELNSRKGAIRKALKLYMKAVILGAGSVEIYSNIVKLLDMVHDKNAFDFFKTHYKTFKNTFYAYLEKNEPSGKKRGQIERLSMAFKRIERHFRKIDG